jgi:hypothetical protein
VDDIDALVSGAGAGAATAAVDAVYVTLKRELEAIGIHFNTKTHVYCATAGVTIDTAAGIAQAHDGIATMGVPVGSAAFVEARARKRLAGSFEQLELLPELDFGDAMRILRYCISRRAAFLAGSLPPAVFAPVAADWDAAVRKCLTRIFAGAPPHARCFLSGAGGLDIHVIVEQLSLLRCMSNSRTVDCINDFMPHLAPLTVPTSPPVHPVHVEVQAAWDSLPASVTGAKGVLPPFAPTPPAATPPPPAAPTVSPLSTTVKATVLARRALTEAFASHQRKELFLSMDDVDRVLLEASVCPGARAWADCVPTYANRQMDSTQARLAHCIWLGGVVAELAGSTDPRGRNLLRADRAGHVNRHTTVCDVLADLEKEAGRAVWHEVTGMFGPAARRYADEKFRGASKNIASNATSRS